MDNAKAINVLKLQAKAAPVDLLLFFITRPWRGVTVAVQGDGPGLTRRQRGAQQAQNPTRRTATRQRRNGMALGVGIRAD
jgi:hypothetical protein